MTFRMGINKVLQIINLIIRMNIVFLLDPLPKY